MSSETPSPTSKIPPELTLAKEGVQLVSVTFAMTFYTNQLFSVIPDAILSSFEKFLEKCPKEKLRFYATTNMRRHKPVTSRTFGMLKAWLTPGAPPREDIDLEIKDGNSYQDAPSFKFAVSAGEIGSVSERAGDANFVTMVFPAEWGVNRSNELIELARDVCADFPVQSGHAGYSFECSRYAARPSQTHAWEKSMLHRGIDIARWPQDGHAVGQDGVKGVGWLTILGTEFLKQLGGNEKLRQFLSEDVDFIEIPGGLILVAGPNPEFGDARLDDDLPTYRLIYDVIKPLVEISGKRASSFNLRGDFVEKKRQWYRRLENV